jgi:FixJ family two-component response regulator
MGSEPTVFVVDDDEAVRDSLRLLLGSVGLSCQTYASAQAFLDDYRPEHPGCVVLDVRMPGMSGIDLQKRLVEMRSILPVIFITGHGDVPMAVHAMRTGAVDFVQKPFSEQDLLDRIQQAIEQDSRCRRLTSRRDEILARVDGLTPREQQVMRMVVDGKANKVIAIDLGVSERTVEIHRAKVMTKMEAESLPHLVKMVMLADQNEAEGPTPVAPDLEVRD